MIRQAYPQKPGLAGFFEILGMNDSMEGVSVLSRGQGTKLGWTVFTIWPGV